MRAFFCICVSYTYTKKYISRPQFQCMFWYLGENVHIYCATHASAAVNYTAS